MGAYISQKVSYRFFLKNLTSFFNNLSKFLFIFYAYVEYTDIMQCLLKWFVHCRNQTIRLGRQILKYKAEQFEASLGHKDFITINDWLDNL